MMATWLEMNWWWLLPIALSPLYVALKVHIRGGDETLPLRILYSLVPILDAKSSVRRKMSPLALALLAVGMLIFLVIFVLIDDR
jgi:hypothetical protein